MRQEQPISELAGKREAHCTRCGDSWEQICINGNWFPREHQGCRNAVDQRPVERAKSEAQLLMEREQRIELRQQQLGMPPLYRRAGFRTFNADNDALKLVKDRAERFVERWEYRRDPDEYFPQVVLMLGPPGTGKGHIAWSIAKEIVEIDDMSKPGLVKVCKCSDIIRDLRESWRNPEAESETKRLNFYRTLDLLVIDEVSKHALYGEPSRHLYDLIDHRQEWLRPTILTSNEDVKGLTELLGSALVSRAAGWDAVWMFLGDDYRVKSRKLRVAS